MSFYFVVNNIHFALEILGALAFLAVAWLAFDALAVRSTFGATLRALGFSLLAGAQVLHAFHFSSELAAYGEFVSAILGALFVAGNFISESPVKRPAFQAVLIVPAFGGLAWIFGASLAALYFCIAILAYRQYRLELKKALIPFAWSFFFLGAGAAVSLFSSDVAGSPLWMAEHGLRLLGFACLGAWVWQYLQLRIREELLLIFVSFTLFMATVVTLTFSTILVGRMEEQTKENLLTDTRVFDFAVQHLEGEALAKSIVLGGNSELTAALVTKDFAALDALALSHVQKDGLGLLTVADEKGDVIVRGHGLTQRGDNIADEQAAASALAGSASVTIESHAPEGLAIRAASPMYADGKLIGVLVAGWPLDNALVDGIKKITGLEMSVFDGNTRVGTTLFNPDGRTRSVGILQTDSRVREETLGKGNGVTLATEILSRPYLASYLPLRDARGTIVGMLSAAQGQQAILETANATNRLTLASVMGIMLILILPIYMMAKRLAEESSGGTK